MGITPASVIRSNRTTESICILPKAMAQNDQALSQARNRGEAHESIPGHGTMTRAARVLQNTVGLVLAVILLPATLLSVAWWWIRGED